MSSIGSYKEYERIIQDINAKITIKEKTAKNPD